MKNYQRRKVFIKNDEVKEFKSYTKDGFYYKSTELVSIEIEHRPDPAGISMGEVEIVSAYSIGNPQQAIRRNTRNIMLVHHPAMNKVVTYEIDDLGDIIRQHNQHD